MLTLSPLTAGTASAGFITYTNGGNFVNAAAAASMNTHFEHFAQNPGGAFTLGDGTGSVTFSIESGFHDPAGLLRKGSFGPRQVFLRSTQVSGTVVGVGFNYTTSGVFSAGKVAILVNSGTPSGGFVTGLQDSPVGFLGILATDESSISVVNQLVSQSSGANLLSGGASFMDNVVVVTRAASTVPEPATLTLVLAALLGAQRVGRVRRVPVAP